MFLANKLNKGAGAPTPKDAQFNYVTMLLHGDGTNGAQNNTFLDSSTNNFTITRNGNTTQGSFSPYGSNWSNFFDGNGDYLYNYTTTTPYAFGQDNFTLEAWVNFASTSGAQGIADSENTTGTGTQADRWFFQKASGGDLQFGRHNVGVVASGTWSPVVGTWYHVVACRSSTTLKLFINGSQVASVTDSTDYQADGIQIGVAATPVWFNGYISNFRAVKGTALYTSSFTPSITPLTAVTNTSILTCQSNRFIDNSTNNVTFTIGGNTSVQRFNPFGTATAYSTSVIGGSGYFDGSGDYLTVADNAAFEFGSGNLTIEGWMYVKDTGVHTLCSKAGSSDVQEYEIYLASGTVQAYVSNGTSWQVTMATAAIIRTNEWNHIAVTRSGSSWVIWVNGVSSATQTASFTIDNNTTALGIGAFPDAGFPTNGYISDFRIVKGTAVYTSAFTPPTAPLTSITNTSILTNFQNAAIFDNAMMNDLETVGNAQISTSVKKYGTGSIKCTGDGNTTTTNSGYLLPNSSSSNLSAFGTGDFTIEFFLYLNSISGLRILLDFRGSTETAFPVLYLNSGTLTYYVEADRITGSSLSTSTWYHIALSRSGTNTKLFVNGTQSGSTYTDSTNYANSSTRTPVIGANSYTFGGNVIGWYALDGHIDDFRITKGFARYTANFTAPTVALPDIGPN